MYEKFFGLKARPFSIAPDPRFLFMSQRHKEALAHLAYGIRHGAGFVLLTGEVGTGKTTICRQILRKLPENTRLAFILNPMLDAKELLATLCDELGIDYDAQAYSLKQLTDNLTRFLLQCHQDDINVVLMIDEAQNLAPEVLEQIRLLTNLETDQRKLLQIILVGQPELQQLLAQKELRQLSQRVTARYHLRPLNEVETQSYIHHRLRIAGTQRSLFSKQAIRAVFRQSDGIPRLINNLCDRALMAAYAEEKSVVAEKHIKVAASESLPPDMELDNQTVWFKSKMAIAAGLIGVLLVGYLVGQLSGGEPVDIANTVTEAKTTKFEAANDESPSLRPEQVSPDLNDRNELFQVLIGDGTRDEYGYFAQARLANRWQLSFERDRDGDFCRFAADYRLKCESGRASWLEVTEMNRPVNLLIENNDGSRSWLTLHGIENNQVDIETVSGRRWVKMDWLLSLWNQRYLMLWQAPPGYSRPISFGDRGDDVNWLAHRMAFVFSDDTLKENRVFDEYMQDLLIDFQTRHGLKADGIAGMNTLIQLNSSTTKNIPKLK